MKNIKNKNNLYNFIDKNDTNSSRKKIIFNSLFIKFFPFYFKKSFRNKISKNFKYLRILNLK
ncbi:hypothetical protein MACJ_004181 (apicoplast) [Theileria orientalis]|uniref:Uncharacterized protein n=1 Tax=Theileria orientalis TaxID=68886 RepID=A0A976SK16_THEOR|nr:hypothetical protein MACJ_004181 [Theileria orientalis]